MEWLEIAKSIGELGIMIVICAIFLYQNNKDRNTQNELNNTLFKTIIDKFNGGPVGVETIAASIGEEVTTIEDVVEPYLLQEGFIKRTPRGRIATDKAKEHLKENHLIFDNNL